MNDKDRILEFLLGEYKPYGEKQRHTANSISKAVDEITPSRAERLLNEMIADNPDLFEDVQRMPNGKFHSVLPSKDIVRFLEDGGYTKIERKSKAREERQDEKEIIDLRLAKEMLKEYPTTKWLARIGFGIAVLLAIIQLISFLYKLK